MAKTKGNEVARPGLWAGMKKVITGKGYVKDDFKMPLLEQAAEERKHQKYMEMIKEAQSIADKVKLDYNKTIAKPKKKGK